MDATRGRRASATRNSATLFIHPVGTTVDGIGIDMPPVHRLDAAADPSDAGRALRESLAASTTRIPPRFWREQREITKEFLKAAHVRSWRQLQTGAVACWIAERDGVIVLTPLRNGGTRGDSKGFQPFGASDVTVAASATDAELGAAVIEALDRSA